MAICWQIACLLIAPPRILWANIDGKTYKLSHICAGTILGLHLRIDPPRRPCSQAAAAIVRLCYRQPTQTPPAFRAQVQRNTCIGDVRWSPEPLQDPSHYTRMYSGCDPFRQSKQLAECSAQVTLDANLHKTLVVQTRALIFVTAPCHELYGQYQVEVMLDVDKSGSDAGKSRFDGNESGSMAFARVSFTQACPS